MGSAKFYTAIKAAQQVCVCLCASECRCVLSGVALAPGFVIVHAGHFATTRQGGTRRGGGEAALGTGESSKPTPRESNQPRPPP